MSKSFVILICILVIVNLFTNESNAENTELLPEGCLCGTSFEWDPVCGNNGVTYPNLSTLKCADKCVNYSIHQIHHGPCKT